MKRKTIAPVLYALSFCFLLSSCQTSQSPTSMFESFSKYRSEDGLMALESQFCRRAGVGKIKIKGEYETFTWKFHWEGLANGDDVHKGSNGKKQRHFAVRHRLHQNWETIIF